MNNIYLARTREDELNCFYHAKGTGLVHKIFEKGRWGKAITLQEGAQENFTMSFDRQGKIYIFCQDANGDIVVLTKDKDQGWMSRVILKNQSSKIHTVQIHPMMSGEGMSLAYNVPSPEEKSNYIVFQKLDEKGQWSEASRIDKFTPMSDCLFTVQNVSEEHLLIFYQTRGQTETNIGYRELTPAAMGSYNIFHTTSYTVTDTAFLTTDKAVHVLYCVRGMFNMQLIYRKKESGAFGNPIVLCDAQKIENCVLSIVKDNLYAFYIANGQLSYRMSENKGETFSKPDRYRKKCCQQPVKANYVSYGRQRENKYYLRQVYVDRVSPWDVQIIPDLNEDFYPVAPAEVPPPKAQEDQSQIILRLKNRIELLKSENAEKDNRMLNLTNLLKIRNEELVAADMLRQKLLDEKKRLIDELKEYSQARDKGETATAYDIEMGEGDKS